MNLPRLALLAALLAVPARGPAAAADASQESAAAAADSLAWAEDDTPEESAPPASGARRSPPLEALVPALATNAYRMSPGPRPYRNRLAFSPGFGALGSERLFAFRFAYHPGDWLGWEAAIDHNPARSVHAARHSLSALLRRPVAGRIQPYLAAGYGMFMVYPGRSLNADPVTKNAVSAGGGLELFLRDDLALRGDLRNATVFGRDRDRDGVVTYSYFERSVGLVFYRPIAR